jgi:archaellum biogenesis protein FlaJ (TadC family)
MTRPDIATYLTTVSLRLFGVRIQKITSRFTAFKEAYHKSGISRSYESYMALMLFAFSVGFTSAATIGALIHYLLFNLTLFRYLIAVLSFSCIISTTIPIIFILYPLYWGRLRRQEIDANLVYTTGYMGVLSAGGIPIERIFERVIQVEQRSAIKKMITRLMANIKMFGLDVTSSVSDITRRSPSETFSKLLMGITNTVKTSGDIKGLLTFETRRLLHAKREQLKKTLATLIALGEVYITAMVMGPIVFIVILTIASIMGNVAFGLSPIEQLNLLVFFGIPMLSTIFILILNSILPEEE